MKDKIEPELFHTALTFLLGFFLGVAVLSLMDSSRKLKESQLRTKQAIERLDELERKLSR